MDNCLKRRCYVATLEKVPRKRGYFNYVGKGYPGSETRRESRMMKKGRGALPMAASCEFGWRPHFYFCCLSPFSLLCCSCPSVRCSFRSFLCLFLLLPLFFLRLFLLPKGTFTSTPACNGHELKLLHVSRSPRPPSLLRRVGAKTA